MFSKLLQQTMLRSIFVGSEAFQKITVRIIGGNPKLKR